MVQQMEMTPYERVMAALRGQLFDVYPAISPTSVVTEGAMQRANAYFPAAHTRAAEMAALASIGHDYFGFDSVMPYFSILLESAALGAEIDWGSIDQTPRIVKTAIFCARDYTVPENFLSLPIFQRLLSAIGMLHKKYRGHVVVIGKVIGPWTLAYHLYGVEKLVLDTMLEPEQTKAFIRELSRIPMAFAKAQFDAGADMVTWADHCTSDLASAAIYADFVAPIHKQAAEELQSGGPLILHICGNIMDRLSTIADTGLEMLHLDSRNDIKKATEIVGDSIALTGCINNPFTLAQGKPRDVSKEVRSCIQKGIRLISPECAVPCRVPDENLLTLVRTAHQRKGLTGETTNAASKKQLSVRKNS